MTASKKKPPSLSVADIAHHGTKLILPEGMTLDQAIDLLERRRDYEEQDVVLQETFDVFPWDGAAALADVLEEVFGFCEADPRGWGKPKMISIKTGVHTTRNIPWGLLRLPKSLGTIHCGSTRKDGRLVFSIMTETLRKNEPTIKELTDAVRERLKTHSIYRGKALALRFKDADGDRLEMPEPEFIDTTVDESHLVLNCDVEIAVDTNLFTPIRRLDDLLSNGVSVKRGVLLGGPYGTGKTMTAKIASKFAVANGITFMYVRRTDELAEVIQFAKPYAERAVVVFCEDIDSVVQGRRDQKVNDVLNTIDGVDTKSMNLITLLTTNHIEDIQKALLRPGRLDAIIEVCEPDAQSVERLLRVYGGDTIPANADLTPVADELKGAIPAIVSEVVKRAKLHQLALQQKGTKIRQLTVEALHGAATTMRAQRDLLRENGKAPSNGMPKVLYRLEENTAR